MYGQLPTLHVLYVANFATCEQSSAAQPPNRVFIYEPKIAFVLVHRGVRASLMDTLFVPEGGN